ncbi:MAG: dienelactone hydrolase family protein [Nitrospina sp.]|jgi:dienelactone hydrolase|nr:dienelactone hydrolase family protein [Nitrospina sp.]MBT3508248.1 dienelactone hydrolase family protein [Nitrospina sp.]MBT3874954.1 dienelactone hydrolase family protein [Nitrospina sp.]MBT4047181.1 dienelactone hydrolase family protein [Nitrospina sp.]MBT4557569.1 dienelactone hydrolase family protein [Nitrospina sp.]
MKSFLQWMFLVMLSFATVAHAEVLTQEINYTHNGTTLKGYLAFDDTVKGKRPGILVVHEWWGHNEHARDHARMLAKIGYTALAVDMYGNGKTADHPKKAGEFMNAAFKDWKTSEARFNKAKEVLQSHKTVDATRIGAIGFCFGGAVSIRMARGGADLDGIVAFHSALPLEPAITNMKASVLVINGSKDTFLKPESVGSFSSQMMTGNVDFTYMNLKGIKHSFTNKQADEFDKKFKIGNLEYNKQADEQSWLAMQKFFQRVFRQ